MAFSVLTFIFYSLMFIGFLAFVSNFAICLILSLKQNKRPSEYLVIFTLFTDSLYGIFLIWLSSASLFIPRSLSEQGFVNGSVYFPYLGLSAASLCLQVLVASNRYIAVMRPFSYKVIFTNCNISISLVIILIISSTFSLVGLRFFKDREDLNRFNLFWYSFRLALVLIEGSLSIALYHVISRQFNVSCMQLAMAPVKHTLCFRVLSKKTKQTG